MEERRLVVRRGDALHEVGGPVDGFERTTGFAPSGMSPPPSLSRGRPRLATTEPWPVT